MRYVLIHHVKHAFIVVMLLSEPAIIVITSFISNDFNIIVYCW